MVLTDVIGFIIGLLVGAFALAAGARFAVYRDREGSVGPRHAVVTALLGALVWGLLGWVPVIGTLLAFVGWLGLLNYRYPGGWTRAAVLAGAAWLVAALSVTALSALGAGVSAVGIPWA